jgi:SAM-dependent methyltransferase
MVIEAKPGIKLLDTMRKVARHIYQRPIVAKHYDKTFVRGVPPEFNRWVYAIAEAYMPINSKIFNVFEGGPGTGMFSIPMIKYIIEFHPNSFYFGIDNSQAMLRVLFSKEDFTTLLATHGDRIAIGFGDLQKKLCFPNSFFKVVILAGVLHCLTDVKATMAELSRVLSKGGYLIIVARTDDATRVQSGDRPIKPDINRTYLAFWTHYYALREAEGLPLDRRCRLVYDLKYIKDEVSDALATSFEHCEDRSFTWRARASFRDMIKAIKYGLSFALGQGISYRDQTKLADEMTRWLYMNSNQIEEIELEYQMEAVIWKKIA